MYKHTLTSGLFAFTTLSLHASIVYQDTFEAADGIGINTAGIGGGLISGTNITGADPFDDASGNAVAQTDFGNRIAFAHTENQFNLVAGFTLTVNFTTISPLLNPADVFPSYTASFGIVDEVTSGTPAANGVASTGNLNSFLSGDQDLLNAVGFIPANRPADSDRLPGLATDFGTLAVASTAANGAINLGGTQTLTLTVNADGSAEFDLDGVGASLAAGVFSDLFDDSLDGEFHFVAYSQGNEGFTLNSVTIETVPEPSSAALLGLGGLAFILRRRK